MYIPDTLSRAYLPDTRNQSEIEHLNIIQYLPTMPACLQRLKTKTESDETLQLLNTVIRDGWPEAKHELQILITPYPASEMSCRYKMESPSGENV